MPGNNRLESSRVERPFFDELQHPGLVFRSSHFKRDGSSLKFISLSFYPGNHQSASRSSNSRQRHHPPRASLLPPIRIIQRLRTSMRTDPAIRDPLRPHPRRHRIRQDHRRNIHLEPRRPDRRPYHHPQIPRLAPEPIPHHPDRPTRDLPLRALPPRMQHRMHPTHRIHHPHRRTIRHMDRQHHPGHVRDQPVHPRRPSRRSLIDHRHLRPVHLFRPVHIPRIKPQIPHRRIVPRLQSRQHLPLVIPHRHPRHPTHQSMRQPPPLRSQWRVALHQPRRNHALIKVHPPDCHTSIPPASGTTRTACEIFHKFVLPPLPAPVASAIGR